MKLLKTYLRYTPMYPIDILDILGYTPIDIQEYYGIVGNDCRILQLVFVLKVNPICSTDEGDNFLRNPLHPSVTTRR